ncbi:16S rRNA (cytidine(1402)-2'-O)-methyltransferase [candidate division WWE3 bacterium]|jgi:16S rRNA (cytidine1402-2'-O)-methyltransferase|uniref:Ribosomal RNA small subunit methyltransferase I n=1 Tax=candidate division WWE3 bacterium TaxID=2053526 RepID=A0A3A4ZIK1_UNCKA|nr:MAG: 16S rRNA (cytidine(1402)-2'-O)-methyltransferase [candidate division WWE3 bacterium]
MTRGKLYIVASPIGNLGDVTYRATEVLKDAAMLLSEDTRETDKLLKYLHLEKPQISYRDQNHKRILPEILKMLENGKDLALISDSGTPLISDPGFNLVRELVIKDFEVISIPGPSSVIAALSISGLPTDKFTFLGFLPKSLAARKELLLAYGTLESTLIIFESPFRVVKLLEEIYGTLGDRYVCVVNDLTKLHEKITRGHVASVLEKKAELKPKGEYIVMVAKKGFTYGLK